MPTSSKILVTGATGKTGGALVTQLLAKHYPVRATVRVQDARSDLFQRRGAEVVVADVFDLPGINPATYERAQEQLVSTTRHLALDDADWTASHGIEALVVVHSPLKEAFAMIVALLIASLTAMVAILFGRESHLPFNTRIDAL